MDGREAMALSSGSNPYFIHRGPDFGGSGYGTQSGALHPPPQFRTSSTQNFQIHNNGMPGSSAPSFSIEHSNMNSGHGHHGHEHGDGIDTGAPPEMSVSEQPVKKKRGRPRKYAPDGQQVSLGLSPMLIKPKQSSEQDPLSPSKRKGRPPGTGRKQRLANLGEWMNKSAGLAFAPHVISILTGEDIVAKILSFAQQRPRAVCILSGTGTASSVTLRQPASSEPTVTYEGRFQILCLSGSYLVAEDGGPRDRTGGISASLSTPDGQVIGGAIGMLTAATLQKWRFPCLESRFLTSPISIMHHHALRETSSELLLLYPSSTPSQGLRACDVGDLEPIVVTGDRPTFVSAPGRRIVAVGDLHGDLDQTNPLFG